MSDINVDLYIKWNVTRHTILVVDGRCLSVGLPYLLNFMCFITLWVIPSLGLAFVTSSSPIWLQLLVLSSSLSSLLCIFFSKSSFVLLWIDSTFSEVSLATEGLYWITVWYLQTFLPYPNQTCHLRFNKISQM